jgi:hypothetical protein
VQGDAPATFIASSVLGQFPLTRISSRLRRNARKISELFKAVKAGKPWAVCFYLKADQMRRAIAHQRTFLEKNLNGFLHEERRTLGVLDDQPLERV